ncbi:MAG: aspartate carbamoyltransferase catalytic subunit [Firmicutes bacterium]|nr:aspartate carbamoyltransferase catalytic subunit [Bacillota bacterium]
MSNSLLGMAELTRDQINHLLERTRFWQEHWQAPPQVLANRTIANLFFEPSTRTRFSFEMAAKRMGAHVLNFMESASSTTKGESLYDTVKTLEAMGFDAVVIRHKENGIVHSLASLVDVPLINAGTGTTEHPTQCLLDLYTISQHFGTVKGITVAIIGDILHSRVAMSHLAALPKMGARVIISGPRHLLPTEVLGPIEFWPIDQAVAEADVVMMLRLQLERFSDLALSVDQYHRDYGLTEKRAKMMRPGAVIMHPGPVNRGVEIAGSLIECERSLINRQVANGVLTRMAILEWVIQGES